MVEEEAALGAVRFEDDTADGWREIDTSLVARSDGTIGPVAVPVDVELGTGSGELIVFDKGGDGEVGFTLDGVSLPVPVLDGPTATYVDVLPGVDASVEVRSGGFEVLWVVKSPEAAQLLADSYGNDAGEVVLPTKVRSRIAPAETAAGDVQFTQLGEVKAQFAAPSMWDSSAEVPGVRGAETDVDFEIAPVVQSRGVRVESLRAVDVVASGEWLTDPERVFPVVIDPTYQTVSGVPSFDTWVQNGVTVDKSAAADLRIGNDGTGMVARSFMNFDAGLFKNRMVRRANLSLFGSYSSTCAQTEFAAYDAGLASTGSRWTAQPTLGARRATSTSTVGKSASCPAARISIDMTAQAQAWSQTTATQVGMMLGATNVLDAYGWKIFHSPEGQNKPVITVFYNRTPDVPGIPTITGLVAAATSSGVKNFIGVAKPTMSVAVKDGDVDTVTAVISRFTSATSLTPAAELCRGSAASGGTVKCTSVPDLPANTSVWIRAIATDGMGWSGYGPAVEVRYGGAIPPQPVIACASGNGSWSEYKRVAETCTITAKPGTMSASAPTSVTYRVDGGTWKTASFTQVTADTQVVSVTVGGSDGLHSVEAYVKSPVGKQSATSAYSFGYGKPMLVSPAAALTTHGSVTVKAKGAPSSAAVLQWRVKGAGETWRDIKAASSGASGEISAVFDVPAALEAASISSRVSVVVEVRGTFQYGTSLAVASDVREIIRVPHAFGAGFPVTEVAGGQIALWTGELQISETDAALTTPGDGLSISRTHSTWAVPATGAQGIFGPGWTASLDGGPTGVSEMELVDNTLVDGTLVLASAEGDVLPFAPPAADTDVVKSIMLGDYLPVGPEAEASELTLKVTTVEEGIHVTATDTDGIATVFSAPAATATNLPAVFAAKSVRDSVTGETTSYQYDSAGFVTAIVAPKPDGIITECLPDVPVDGCRMLKLSYSGAGVARRLDAVEAQVNTDPDRTLATFTYSAGRLAAVTDQVAGVTTEYTWTGSDPQPKLATLSPPGEDAFTYTYDATTGKLSKVTRLVPATAGGGVAQLAGIVYGTTPGEIPGLDLAQFDRYDLPRTATKAVAVFGPDAPFTGTAPSAELWKRADVWLTDEEGYTIHEARFGGGQWQLTAMTYDESDNVVQHWDTRATAELRKGESSAYSDVASAATTTVYNADPVTAPDGTVLVPARTRVTDVWSPAADILVTGAEYPQLGRRHVATTYDQGAPTPGRSLVTTQVATAERSDGTVLETLTTTWTGYEALEAGDTSGWDLRQPTSVTLDMNGNGIADADDIVKQTRYDDLGRVIEQRQPGAGSTDPGTRTGVFWSAGTNSRDTDCQGQPQWAGFLCKEGPASQPAGVNLPVTIHSDYVWHGAARTERDVSGSVTRTTATTFDAKARPVTVSTDISGLAGSTPVPTVTTEYDAYGRVIRTESTAGTSELSYDSWGRQLTYKVTPAGGVPQTTTTQYNALGDITSVTTPTSVTAYTYDGTDANGNLEYRGLLTGTVTTVAGFTTQSTAAYDAHGALIKEVLPGAIERRTDFDLTGELVSQAYWGPEAGSAGPVPWLGWTLTVNAAGQIITEHGPDASPATGLDLVTSDVGLRYGYDQAGRLATVNDSTAGQCTTRQYLFDQRGNRTGLTQTTGPTCDAPPVTATRVYDSADRALTGADGTGAYTYDPLGRQLAIPAIDAPNPAAGDIALGYYDDDTARSITQGDTVLTYDLDVAGRRASQTTTTAGTVTGAVVNHYTDASDNPGWITTNHAGASTTTVYTDQVASDLTMAIITDAAGTRGELALATPRGDITTTISLNTPTAQADGLDNWTHYTEYGQPTTTPPTSTTGTAGNGYGWLGTKQRTTTTTGLLLMGARLYNPTTALFTSDDPIYGGNNTPYTYPNDPINDCDASGRQSCASLAQAMNETISILRRRNNESYANKYNLPLEGKNSIRGHQNQYSGYQKRLKNQAREFEKKCSYVKFGKNFKSNVRHWEAKQMTLPWNMKFYSKGRYSPKMARAASVRLPGFRGGASLGRGGGGAGRPWATK
ncbi:DNRLRE domain-containing protein [Tessaracoccus lubricantis]|uniref:DNRLRE domain-containing protein n=1 Tax=Tessaracoccus lubricantis TaxID=545543 RepID=UPI0031E4F4DC